MSTHQFFAEFVVVLSVIGLGSSIGEKLISDTQRDTVRRYERRLRYWLYQTKKAHFSYRMRQPRTILGMCIPPIAFAALVISMAPNSSLEAGLALLTIAAVCAPLLWWMSRSGNDRAFVFRFIILAAAIFALYHLTVYWLTSDIEDAAEMIFIGPLIGAFQFFCSSILAVVFVVAFLPFLAAQSLSWFLYVSHFYVRYCIENNRLAFMAICAISGGIATVYGAVVRAWP